jgi:hypothetical protein
MQRTFLWMPWILLAVLGMVYVGELIREMSVCRQALFEVILQFSLAGLLFFALALIILVGQQEYQAGAMRRWVCDALYWTPRIVALLFVLLLGMFSLDVFDEGFGFWQTILALLIHNIPAAILLAAIVLAWRWEWIGAVGLMVWVAFFCCMAIPRLFAVSVYVDLAGLPFVLGVLFLLNWLYRAELRANLHVLCSHPNHSNSIV